MTHRLNLPARYLNRRARQKLLAASKHQQSYTVSADAVRDAISANDLGRLLLSQERAAWKWTHYPDAYTRELGRFRGTGVKFLELGVHRGGSLLAWKEYLGSDATVFGVDIDPTCAEIDGVRGVDVRIGSQDDAKFLETVVNEMGGVDVVVDDGSHQARHQRDSLATLFPLLNEGGVYVVEDLHTSYWPEYGGKYGRGNGFIEVVKQIIDDLHGWHHVHDIRLPEVDAQHFVPRISIYDSVVFLHKEARSRPANFKTHATGSGSR